jgi:amidase
MMSLADYSNFDGVALAELVRKQEVTPKELASTFVEAVEMVNHRINAVIEFYLDRIEGLSDDHAIFSNSPFVAVPFLMKDIGAHEVGRHQESGSRLMKGFIADKD